jgi:hypothetical protein
VSLESDEWTRSSPDFEIGAMLQRGSEFGLGGGGGPGAKRSRTSAEEGDWEPS